MTKTNNTHPNTTTTTPHEASWLVVSFARRDGRFIVEGTLGCPVCHRQYPIRDGVARLWEALEPYAKHKLGR